MPAKLMMGNVIRKMSMSFLIFQIITSAHCQPPRGPIIVSPQVNLDKTASLSLSGATCQRGKTEWSVFKGTRNHAEGFVGNLECYSRPH